MASSRDSHNPQYPLVTNTAYPRIKPPHPRPRSTYLVEALHGRVLVLREVPLDDRAVDLVERRVVELVDTDHVEVPREPPADGVAAGAREPHGAHE